MRTRRSRLARLAAAALLVPLAACGQGPNASPTAPSASAPGPTSATGSPGGPSSAPSDDRTTADPTGGSSGSSDDKNSSAPASDKTGSAGTGSDGSGSDGTGDGQCASLAGELSLDQQIGQLFMAATSSSGMSDAEAQQLSTLKVGSVLLLGNSTAGRSAVAGVTDAIKQRVGTDHGVKVLLAADQEGGQVQRLAGQGFDTIPSAVDQADLSDDDLQSAAEGWGRQLKDAGIDVDLAPVSDVVPKSVGSANEPIGALDRGYGPKPAVVARKNVAFVKGMESAGIGTSVKHFPGLGIVRGNTDFETDVHDSVTTRDDKRLAGFRAGVQAGADMVMVSSATYDKIDPDHPATFSKTVVRGMIRSDLRFDGVIISDDILGKALDSVPVRERALRFIRAGGDLAIVGQSSDVEPMVDAVRQAADDDPELQSKIQDAATRVLIMKARRGLADCSA